VNEPSPATARLELALLLGLTGVILALSAAIAGRAFTPPTGGAAAAGLATVTPTGTPAAGWWDDVPLVTPALAGLPALPQVSLGGAAAQAGVPVPFSIISCPTPGTTIRRITTAKPGWWNLEGDAEHAILEYWKGEISPDGSHWTMLYRSPRPVQDGLLIEFNTRTVPKGAYLVRLTVVDRTGNYGEPCIVRISTG
jgi:hypothetical protein